MSSISSAVNGDTNPPRNLEDVLELLRRNAEGKKAVTIESMMEAVGRRSFGPLILLVGIIAMSPLSGIPTIPSILGVIVALIAGQMVAGRKRFWLPNKLLNRKIPGKRVVQALNVLAPVGRFTDRILRPRLTFATRHIGASIIAVICVMIGLTMPPLEILPFLATTAGAALTLFGLALIAEDGVVAIVAIVLTVGLMGFAFNSWVL